MLFFIKVAAVSLFSNGESTYKRISTFLIPNFPVLCPVKWCRGVVVKHADSQHRGGQFDSSIRYSKNAIGEEGNKKPPHKTHFHRKN